MPVVDPLRFIAELERGRLPAVVAIGGEARVLVDDALVLVRRLALEGGVADFNHDRVPGQRGVDAVLGAASTLPMMSARRLVEVDRAEDLGEEGAKALERYLEAPVSSTVLVLKLEQVDLRAKLTKVLEKKATLVKCEHPRERDMPQLVAQRAARYGVTLDEETALAVALTVGTDLGLADRALEKLALVAPDRPVTLDDVSTHVADTHLEDAFAFAAAVGKSDRREALMRLNALMKNRAAPLQLLGLVAWQLRQVLKARELLDEGRGPRDVREGLRAFGARGDALIDGARRFELRAHERRLGRLGLVDRMLKSSRAKDALWLERLVLELCPEKSERARTTPSRR